MDHFNVNAQIPDVNSYAIGALIVDNKKGETNGWAYCFFRFLVPRSMKSALNRNEIAGAYFGMRILTTANRNENPIVQNRVLTSSIATIFTFFILLKALPWFAVLILPCPE